MHHRQHERTANILLASSGLAAGMVMCIALSALATAINPEPRISVSKEAVYHAEDSVPLPIGTPGALPPPHSVAAPTRSLWQTDTIGIRLVMPVSWGLRTTGAVAWAQAVTW